MNVQRIMSWTRRFQRALSFLNTLNGLDTKGQ